MSSVTYNEQALRDCCLGGWDYFERKLGKKKVMTERGGLIFIDRGAPILGIAHLDYVCQVEPYFIAGKAMNTRMVLSPALDNRLGAYLLIHVMHRLNIVCDILLTDGEETGQSTGQFFHKLYPDKKYNWMFQFDRLGDDIVTYQYKGKEWEDAIKLATARKVTHGMSSDICKMDDVGCNGMNIGIGYQEYHGPYSRVLWRDVNSGIYSLFHMNRLWRDTSFPYTKPVYEYKGNGRSATSYGHYNEDGTYVWTPADPKVKKCQVCRYPTADDYLVKGVCTTCRAAKGESEIKVEKTCVHCGALTAVENLSENGLCGVCIADFGNVGIPDADHATFCSYCNTICCPESFNFTAGMCELCLEANKAAGFNFHPQLPAPSGILV